MKTVSDRINVDELRDIFSVRDLGRAMGLHGNGAYELAKSENFPSWRVGKKILISKVAFLRWLEQQGQKKVN